MALRLSKEEFETLMARRRTPVLVSPSTVEPSLRPPHSLEGRARYDGFRSKTELLYSQVLDLQRLEGSIKRWAYEEIGFKLAPKMHYWPDFAIWLPDGTLMFDEVKGSFIRDKAMNKPKSAAVRYPEHRFRLVQKLKSSWRFQDIPAR